MSNPNQDQADFWSKKPGLTWSENDAAMDATLAPVLDQILELQALFEAQGLAVCWASPPPPPRSPRKPTSATFA